MLYLPYSHKAILDVPLDEEPDILSQSIRHTGYVFAKDATDARLGAEEATEYIDCGGLACSVFTKQTEDATTRHGKGEIAVDQSLTVVVSQVVTLD